MARGKRGPTPEDMAKCQTWNHLWDEYSESALYQRPEAGVQLETLLCSRCTTERFTKLDDLGNVLNRRYVYPEGYRYAKGERPTRAELRQAMMRRYYQKERLKNSRQRTKVS